MIFGVVLNVAADDREGLNKTRDVLLRANGSGIEQKRVADLITLENAVAFGLGRAGFVASQEQGVGRVVDEADAFGSVGDQSHDVPASCAGDRDDSPCAFQTAAETKGPGSVQKPLGVVEEKAAEIVNGHRVGFFEKERNTVERDMCDVGAQAPDQARQREVIDTRCIAPGVRDGFEAGRQMGEERGIFRRADQFIAMTGIGGGERLEQVPDVGADTEVANAARVDRDLHGVALFTAARRRAGIVW